MATSDDVRVKPRSSILNTLGKGNPAHEPETAPETENVAGPDDPERSDPLPRPGNPYMAHARRASKPQMTLFYVGKDYLPNGYSYANLERVWLAASGKEGGGPVLMVRFYGSVVTEVTIEGRHLESLCNAIGMHLMPWVWEHPSPRDFGNENETIIRKITPKQIQS